MDNDVQRFKDIIEEHHHWPCQYLFKFIVPVQKKEQVLGLFESKDEISQKKSRNGRYVSISARCLINCSEEVLLVYQAAARIKGVISL
ncbi:MAG: DUF493 domain-containing protein [Desulfohalobiaceae bacterium]|nr:DUF493 domain-containing protein [Desulfohalobiaceae bacterium]